MGMSDVAEWNLDSIIKRDVRISDSVIELFSKWENEYLAQTDGLYDKN